MKRFVSHQIWVSDYFSNTFSTLLPIAFVGSFFNILDQPSNFTYATKNANHELNLGNEKQHISQIRFITEW